MLGNSRLNKIQFRSASAGDVRRTKRSTWTQLNIVTAALAPILCTPFADVANGRGRWVDATRVDKAANMLQFIAPNNNNTSYVCM